MSGGWTSGKGRIKFRSNLFKHQGGKCCYCEKDMVLPPDNAPVNWINKHKNAATFEHMHQKCEGGSNHRTNIMLACRDCNKGRPNDVDWMTYKSYCMGEIDQREMHVLAREARYLTRERNPIFKKEFSKMQLHFIPDLLEKAVVIRERVTCG